MAKIREKQAHLWERDDLDWYVEPKECSRALFYVESFNGPIWDPACGIGRIVEQAVSVGKQAFGSDVINRSIYCEFTANFLDFEYNIPRYSNIVMNPPFSLAEEFIKKSINIIPNGGKIAAILPLVWLAGFSTKRDWLPESPLRKVFPISPRPSMPPGKVVLAGEKPGNGTKDFCWLVWQKGYTGRPEVEFLNTQKARMDILAEGGESRIGYASAKQRKKT